MRTCGDCRACCVTPDIETLGKKAGEPCPNLTEHGCGIYDTRPDVCRRFECGWKVNEKLRADDRPDKVGILLMGLDEPRLVVAHELRRGAFDSWKGERLLKREAKRRVIGLARFGKPATVRHLDLFGPARMIGALKAAK